MSEYRAMTKQVQAQAQVEAGAVRTAPLRDVRGGAGRRS